MYIGPYQLANPYILAPMAGVSEMPFRLIARQHGAAAAPTELISAKGLLYGQARTTRYLTHAACEMPFWVQLFGGDAASMAEGAERAVALGAQIIDINMGCPVKKVTKNGAGSALLSDPARAASLVAAIRARTGVPVTVKIRAGADSDHINCVEVGLALQAAGAAAIALHARSRAQGYSGHANWQWIADLVAALDIPVIGNGDVRSASDAQRMLEQTGCQAVMIGRAALGNPWLFAQCAAAPHVLPLPSPQARWEVIQQHFGAHLQFVGETSTAIKRFRAHLMWYAHGIPGAAAFRAQVCQIDAMSTLMRCCAQFYQDATPQPTLDSAPFEVRSALG